MNEIAFYFCGLAFSWHGVVVAAGVIAGMILALAAAKTLRTNRIALQFAILLGIPNGVVLARIMYRLSSSDKFIGRSTFFALQSGGYALYGAMLGLLIACVLVGQLMKNSVSTGALLDACAVGGAAAICIGRLSAFFSLGEDCGQIVDNEKLRFFPYAVFVPQSSQWFVAVFVFEAFAAGVICALLLMQCFREEKNGVCTHRDGDLCLAFLLYYGCAQALLESFRGDSLYFSFLGLVRVSQAVSAVVVAVVLVLVSVRVVKQGSLALWKCIAIWVGCLGALAAAFVTELTLSSSVLVRGYLVMGGCLLLVAVLGTILLRYAAKGSERSLAVE